MKKRHQPNESFWAYDKAHNHEQCLYVWKMHLYIAHFSASMCSAEIQTVYKLSKPNSLNIFIDEINLISLEVSFEDTVCAYKMHSFAGIST